MEVMNSATGQQNAVGTNKSLTPCFSTCSLLDCQKPHVFKGDCKVIPSHILLFSFYALISGNKEGKLQILTVFSVYSNAVICSHFINATKCSIMIKHLH